MKGKGILEYIIKSKKYYFKFEDDYSNFSKTKSSISSVSKYEKYTTKSFHDLVGSKYSDTAFVLGSGPSINAISEEQWKIIDKSDSWGFNFFYIHDFIPTHYIFQSPRESDLALKDDVMSDIFVKKKEKYINKNCNFIARGDEVNKFRFHLSKLGKEVIKKGDTIFLSELFISNQISPAIIQTLFDQGMFDLYSAHAIPKLRSTIVFITSLLLMLGYKKIVLCGIDMNGLGHFYNDDKYLRKYPYLKNIINTDDKSSHPHSKGLYTVKDYLLEMSSFARYNFNAEILTESKSSLLYPGLNHYKIN